MSYGIAKNELKRIIQSDENGGNPRANFDYIPPETHIAAKKMFDQMARLPKEDREPFEPKPGEPDTRTRSQVYADQLRAHYKEKRKRSGPVEVFREPPPEQLEKMLNRPTCVETPLERPPIISVALGLLAVLAVLAWGFSLISGM